MPVLLHQRFHEGGPTDRYALAFTIVQTVYGVFMTIRGSPSKRKPVDANYAVHLPMIDRLFGTCGVVGDGLPKGMVRQFVYPFRLHTV